MYAKMRGGGQVWERGSALAVTTVSEQTLLLYLTGAMCLIYLVETTRGWDLKVDIKKNLIMD